MRRSLVATCALLAVLTVGCDDDKGSSNTKADAGGDSGTNPAGKDGGMDAATMADPVTRGTYLVEAILLCGDCHTPTDAMGMPDQSKLLSGVDCFIDADPATATFGCLSTPNLTNDVTGLKNRSDSEIKDMLLRGKRPDGKALHNFMPYWAFANMSEEDADAVIAYLRTVPAISHMVTPTQAPFLQDKPSNPLDLSAVPAPKKEDKNYVSAMRGRYLAANLGVCIECHTPENQMDSPVGMKVTDEVNPRDISRAFQGGRVFPRNLLGLPPVFPELIFSHNLTPGKGGIMGWTAEDVVMALMTHKDKDGAELCAPMPAFTKLTDRDAIDIANYLLSLPPVETPWPECTLMAPPGNDGGP